MKFLGDDFFAEDFLVAMCKDKMKSNKFQETSLKNIEPRRTQSKGVTQSIYLRLLTTLLTPFFKITVLKLMSSPSLIFVSFK